MCEMLNSMMGKIEGGFLPSKIILKFSETFSH